MKTVRGISVQGGVAVGPLRIWQRSGPGGGEAPTPLSPAEELDRLEWALAGAVEELEVLRRKTLAELGEEAAAIVELQQLLLEDEDLLNAIQARVREQARDARTAALEAGEELAALFDAMEGDLYMQARAADLRDVTRRVARLLASGAEAAEAPWEAPAILAADDLSPSEAVGLDRSKLLGIVTRGGSPNGHTAILARAMGVPALVGADFDDAWDGAAAILDGDAGTLCVDPAPDTLAGAVARQAAEARRRELLEELRGKENVTLDGHRVEVWANIGGLADARAALDNDAGGVGLFRTEFLFLGAEACPGEEEQFRVYREVVETMAGRRVVIRTLDVGADKGAACLDLPLETNPALGLRAIRVSLTRPGLFRQQLRAVLRAAAYGPVSVMFPLVVSASEVRRAKVLLEECRAELEGEGIPAGPLEVGVMIETPAAVMIAGELAKEVDFFSLGTNDLTQYTLALDRQDPRLAPYWDPKHPAVLRMLRETVEAAHRQGIWVGLCGELAADPEATETLLRLGVDELSVAPAAVLPLRQRIRGLRLN